MPDQPTSHSQILDHLGLVAGLCDALGLGDVLDQATHQNPEMRDLTVGEAVQAMGRNGLGFVHHALSLVPRFFQHTPTSRLIAPRVAPAQLHDDALGRTLETLYASGVTASGATCPDQKGKRSQNPTARWVFHDFVGIQVLYLPQQWPIVINLTEEHQHLLQLLGNRYAWFYR